MMLPCLGKNRMVRLPWIKGLLGVFDFVKFIEYNNCSPIIKDIYGVKHDVIAEDIQIVFTKSQFKMSGYYDSWNEYKENFKKYNCSAGYTNIEEDRIPNAKINYQMLQTLTDITPDEIEKITRQSVQSLNNLCSSVDNIKSAFGITPYNSNKSSFQKAIDVYPDLINDEYVKSQLRQIKDSMVKKFKSGKLQICGKYTFVLPDFYAACEHWFMGVEEPKGLLDDGEVFCWLFRKNKKLDCLRSPHLFREHPIRKNIACEEYTERQKQIREWFSTDAIYTSCKDLISKFLQFDVDGDKLLVVSDETLIKVAERNMKDIVPLYYNMRKASPTILSNQSIYDGLITAFTGGNIGVYSNDICKIWHDDVFVNGNDEEKQEAIDCIKRLCCQNNFVIDFAKTLYKPEFPKEIKKQILKYINSALPHFFKYAKDKTDNQICVANESFVNQLDNIIPNPRINCRSLKLGAIDYTLLMQDSDIECKVAFTDKGKIIKEETDPLIIKYCELNSKHHFQIDNILYVYETFSSDVLMKTQIRQDLLYKRISNEIKSELLKFGYNEQEITDILVKFLYGIKKSKHKSALWLCYGNYIYKNLQKHFKHQTKSIQCVDCGEWFEIDVKDTKTCRCRKCYLKYRKNYKAEKEKERRNRLRGQTKINL